MTISFPERFLEAAASDGRTALSRRRMIGASGAAIGALAGSRWSATAHQASPVAIDVASCSGQPSRWVAAWAHAPRLTYEQAGGTSGELPPLTGRTLRQIVRPSVGGGRVRVRLTNAHADGPVTVNAAHLALLDVEARIVPETDRVLTFGGETVLTLPPDAVAASDPVTLKLLPQHDLAVSLYLPGTISLGPMGLQTTYVSPPGDFSGEAELPIDKTARTLVLLTGLDVLSTESTAVVASPGASTTEGVGSTPGANRRWTDTLAARALAASDAPPLAVVNVGIDGNRLLHDGFGEFRYATGISGLARFDRDVLAQPGVTHLILMEGLGDIGAPAAAAQYGIDASAEEVSVEAIIAGQRILIERAHGHGFVVIGGTLTPWGGSIFDTPETEAKRQAVNDWIRAGGAFDAVVDFEAAVRDPADPTRLLPSFDSGDHGHPSDAGYRAMAEAIDLALFRVG